MAKGTSGSDTIDVGTEAWNIAQGYVMTKVLKLTIEIDTYERLAQYGSENMDERNMMEGNVVSLRRIEGIERFASTLRQLIGNVRFAMKKDGFKTLDILKSRLETVESTLPYTYESYEDEVTHEKVVEIREDLFMNCLRILQDIKDTLNIPMNDAGLVFKASEDFDLEALMDDIALGG